MCQARVANFQLVYDYRIAAWSKINVDAFANSWIDCMKLVVRSTVPDILPFFKAESGSTRLKLRCWTAFSCQIWSKSVKTRPRYGDFSIFPRWRPSAILHLCVCWDHPRRHLVVFIAVQNLVGIDAVVLIICMFSISRVWLENACSRPQNWGFGDLTP